MKFIKLFEDFEVGNLDYDSLIKDLWGIDIAKFDYKILSFIENTFNLTNASVISWFSIVYPYPSNSDIWPIIKTVNGEISSIDNNWNSDLFDNMKSCIKSGMGALPIIEVGIDIKEDVDFIRNTFNKNPDKYNLILSKIRDMKLTHGVDIGFMLYYQMLVDALNELLADNNIDYYCKDLPEHIDGKLTFRLLKNGYEIDESLNEVNSTNSNLLIVDVQKSFKKYFTSIYVDQLMKYCKQFTNVYQVWDNHVDGKNPDVDYLYDDNPDIPVNPDLYNWPNQRDIIEKRYNYNVSIDFFKKILDKQTYQNIKSLESQKRLKVGNKFQTTEGTHIFFVGNNHKWVHLPKKLYNLLNKLKGQELIVVGGSDLECLHDIFVAAESIGVKVKRDHRYIWSASNCPKF